MFKFTTKYLKSKQALNKCNVKYLNDLANYEKRNFIYPSTKHFKSSYKLKSIFEIFTLLENKPNVFLKISLLLVIFECQTEFKKFLNYM